MVATLVLLVLGNPSVVWAQPTSGLYEGWSDLQNAPFGPLAEPPPSSLLPSFVEVHRSGTDVRVRHLPEGRVTAELAWGTHGPTRRRVRVDGQLLHSTEYHYDAQGRLQRSVATGPGLSSALRSEYRYDRAGRLVQRQIRTQVLTTGGWEPRRWDIHLRYTAREVQIRTEAGGKSVREDRFDLQGRPLRTTLIRNSPWANAYRSGGLEYRRGRDGTLLQVDRWLRKLGRGRAEPTKPDPRLTPTELLEVTVSPLRRSEALLLLGASRKAWDDGRGPSRSLRDSWAQGCWKDTASGITWTADGVFGWGFGGSAYGSCYTF